MVEATTARNLLTALGSVGGVFSASLKQLMEVEGIGPKKAKRIRDLIEQAYGLRP